MLTLYCFVVGVAGSAFPVDIEASKSVGHLKNAIADYQKLFNDAEFVASKLQLFLAKQDAAWLTSDNGDVKALKKGEKNDNIAKLLREDQQLQGDSSLQRVLTGMEQPSTDQIHFLVVVPIGAQATASAFVQAKKRRVERKTIAFAGPLHSGEYSVPVETIAAFTEIQAGFSRLDMRGHPLYLLYGPRQFGKTTIAYRIADWVEADPRMANVDCIAIELCKSDVRDVATFWASLASFNGSNGSCSDAISFIKQATRGKRRFCLIVDKMDLIFDNKDLAKQFLAVLRTWKAAPFFCGFLGVGSHDLVYHYWAFRGDTKSSPFNVGHLLKVDRFSLEQMSAFFTLIAPRFQFSESVRRAIAEYSSGAPGVFGSMIRFTVDNDKFSIERREWELWFKVDAFASYLTTYNSTYNCIRDDLRRLNDMEWKAVKYVLEHDGERMTASQVEGNCGVLVRSIEESRLVDPLLRMGILIEGRNGALTLVSEMMYRVCVEALPAREIKQVASTDDPLELLCVALRLFKPQRISNQIVGNRQAPSEVAFHFELFATLRDIMKKVPLSKGLYAEVITPGSRTRADILLVNGIRLAYELKSNQLSESEITAAAEEAENYKEQFKIDGMVVVNFVPRGHLLDPLYQVEHLEHIKIIHAQFADSCDEFDVSYLEDGQVQHRVVKAGMQ